MAPVPVKTRGSAAAAARYCVIVLELPVLFASGMPYTTRRIRVRVNLDRAPASDDPRKISIKQTFLIRGDETVDVALVFQLADLAQLKDPERNGLTIVVNLEPRILPVEQPAPPVINIENIIEAPERKVTIERNGQGQIKGATVTDSC